MKDTVKNNLFQIGEVADMFHLSVGTLRHYEQLGLISPEYTDAKTGYRYYGLQQFEILTTIRFLRRLDMPLKEIHSFLNHRTVESTRNMLQRQKETILKKQNELKQIEKKIDYQLNILDDALSSRLNEPELKHIPPQRVAMLRTRLSPTEYFDLEPSIRRLEMGQKEPIVWLGKVGVGISMEKLKNGSYSEYDFVFITINPEDSYSGDADIWRETDSVSIRFCGGHRDAPEYYGRLIDYINRNNYTITGFSREITLIDNCLTEEESKFVTEIQIPISKADK